MGPFATVYHRRCCTKLASIRSIVWAATSHESGRGQPVVDAFLSPHRDACTREHLDHLNLNALEPLSQCGLAAVVVPEAIVDIVEPQTRFGGITRRELT
jgi:hypothetical protein